VCWGHWSSKKKQLSKGKCDVARLQMLQTLGIDTSNYTTRLHFIPKIR
jgi:hypothetical protein